MRLTYNYGIVSSCPLYSNMGRKHSLVSCAQDAGRQVSIVQIATPCYFDTLFRNRQLIRTEDGLESLVAITGQ